MWQRAWTGGRFSGFFLPPVPASLCSVESTRSYQRADLGGQRQRGVSEYGLVTPTGHLPTGAASRETQMQLEGTTGWF